MRNTHPKKGTVFLHNNMPDIYWRPVMNETEENRPLALMRVTSVKADKVYFTYVDNRDKKNLFSMSTENWQEHYARNCSDYR